MAEKKSRERSPGCLTHVVLYIGLMAALYFSQYPREFTAPLPEAEERHFRVAVVERTAPGDRGRIVPISLAALKAGKVDRATISFLLPPGEITVDMEEDHHGVTVLERRPDSQLIEYHFGNTRESISRYRAFADRVEPISYRIVADVGLGFGALLMLVPAAVLGTIVNWAWKRAARRKGGRAGA